MKLNCPKCSHPLAVADVNMEADTALCRHCEEAFAVSELMDGGSVETNVDLSAPPRGAWCREDGMETRIGATTRSAGVIVLIFFTLFWNGMTFGGLYGEMFRKGEFNLLMSLFGIPFALIGVSMASMCAMMIFGHVEVRLAGEQGSVFTGVGALERRRRFRISEVEEIREDYTSYKVNDQARRCIVLKGAKRIAFGSMLNDARREFVLAALRAHLRPGRGGAGKHTATSRETEFQAER